jgi:hypothetical protein
MAAFDPTEIQLGQQQRRAQIAQMLLQQGMQQEPLQMAGPIAIAQSPVSALMKGLMAYQGYKGLRDTDTKIGEITQQRDQTDKAAIQQGFDLLNKGDTQGALTAFSSTPRGQSYADELLKSKLPKQEGTPADQQIFQWLQTQPKETQEAYQKYKTYAQKPETPYFTSVPTSTGLMVFDNRTGKYSMATDPGMRNGAGLPPVALPPAPGAMPGQMPPNAPPPAGMPPAAPMGAPGPRLLPVAADPGVQGAVARSQAVGRGEGEAQTAPGKIAAETAGNAKVQYGALANSVNEIDRDIERLRSHPGLGGITGVRGAIPNFPNTDAADAQAQLEKLKGGVFLQARNALKGGGQITDYEGMKAEQAYGRMQQSQSKEAFLQALDDYQGHIKKGLDLLNQQSGGNFGAPSATPAPTPASGSRFKVEVVQ